MFSNIEEKIGNIRKNLIILGLTVVLSIVGRCEGGARARFGCYAASTPGTRFISFKELGHHSYSHGFGEGNGIVYTCRGGHIDIVHLRLGADYTKDAKEKAYNCIIKGKKGFDFKLPVESTVHHVQIFYPSNWDSLSGTEKEKTAREISLKLAPYIAFSATTWHEMLTWYDYKCLGFIPEDASAFSWEDSYSNLLGCLLAVEAMKDTQHSYNEAMTIALRKEMQKLGIRSRRFARMASEKMRGKWFTGNLWVTLKKRNFDIGLDDGFVSPSLVPGLKDCSETVCPISYPAPNLDFLSDYGFSIKYEIEPHEFEKGKLLRIVYPNGEGKKIEPEKHFPILIKQIEKEALARGCLPAPYKGCRNKRALQEALYSESGRFDSETGELDDFGFDLDFYDVDVKKSPDRSKRGYFEVSLESYTPSSMWLLALLLEENGYMFASGGRDSLRYCSPDGKTRVCLDEAGNLPDRSCRIIIRKGELTEDQLPEAEREIRVLFDDFHRRPTARGRTGSKGTIR